VGSQGDEELALASLTLAWGTLVLPGRAGQVVAARIP
jgi:hypothetical protein